jgi:glycosyltransferase involved in cell wall biosynthesis
MTGRPARVLFLTVGDRASPGTRLRALAYRPYLENRGHRVEVLFPMGTDPNRLRRRRLLRSLELVRDLKAASRANVVVVYRKTFPGWTARLLRRVASAIVYEYDDAVYLPSPVEPQDDDSIARYRRNFRTTVDTADLVVAGNDHLAQRAGHPRTEVLPTGVDLRIFEPVERAAARDGCIIGWVGTAGNLPQWTRLLPVFERVLTECPRVRFKVVSDGEPPSCGLPVDFERFTVEREARCLEDFDIGLMPLDDTAWNRGKCSYKALQCMAMGQPVVVSPVGMNREVVVDGVSGYFASTDDDWVCRLLLLARDPDLRSTVGRRARSVVEERFSLELVGARMTEMVERLVD